MKTSIPDKNGVGTIWEKVKNRSIPVKTLTKADYDILDEDQKNADVVYVITNNTAISDPITVDDVEMMVSEAVAAQLPKEYEQDGWHIREWPNGWVDMCTNVIKTYAIERTFGNVYITNSYFTIPYPFAVNRLYHESISVYGGNPGCMWLQFWGKNTANNTTAQIYLSSPISRASSDYHITVHVLGFRN